MRFVAGDTFGMHIALSEMHIKAKKYLIASLKKVADKRRACLFLGDFYSSLKHVVVITSSSLQDELLLLSVRVCVFCSPCV